MSQKKIKIVDFAAKIGVGGNSVREAVEKLKLAENPTPNTRLSYAEVERLLRTEFQKALSLADAQRILDQLRDPVEVASPKVQEDKPKVQEESKPKIELKVVGNINDKQQEQAPKIITVEEKPVEYPVPAKEEIKPEPIAKPEPKAEVAPVPVKDEKPAPVAVEPKPVVEEPKEAVSETKSEPKDAGVFRASTPSPGIQFNVVGKIDLDALNSSTRPSKKSHKEREDRKKRQRVKEAVDVKAEAAKISQGKKPNAGGAASTSGQPKKQGGNAQPSHNNAGKGATNNGGRHNNQGGGNADNRHKQKGKEQRGKQGNTNNQPVSEEDVQRQVKETLARLTSKGNQNAKGAKYRKDKREAARSAADADAAAAAEESKVLKLTEFVTVSDLANLMDVPVTKVIGTCMTLGLMVSINMRLDAETIDIVAEEFGFTTNFVSAELAESISQQEEEDNEEDLVGRPPIVTVMGHVDHGKTSLLDRLRNTNVIAGEAGGITQHIGAYSLKLKSGKRITFLDTPGHEAFTAMRARGAKITDIAIIIVAADDDVMPQTKEAINHAAAAGVPMVFAINKIDKPGANPDRIREQLAAMNYLVEEWGGKYQCQEISAKQGINIEELLEKVLLEAELLELKANPVRRATGSIIESSLDKGRGYVATVMVQNGTLRTGDVVLAGTHFGKVKAMFNERNARVAEAAPSTPVLILGLDGAPTAGETFNVMETEQEARALANKREQLKREQDNRTKKGLTLDELARRRALGNFQELNVIIKGDVDGSIEALSDSLIRLSTEEIQVNVIHKGVGAISESDVVLSAASSAIIIGFQVRPSQAAKRLADREGVEIRTYSIIYDTIEDIKSAMEGMLAPEIKENVVANLEVQQTFKITKVGTIAGCMVIEGKIKRNNKIRLIRDGIVKYQGALGSLKRFKDDAKEVVMGQDCGLNIDGYNDIMVGDIIEAYEEIEIKKTLD